MGAGMNEPKLDARLIASYLNDHHAGAVGGLELARRARSANEGSSYGEALARLAAEIEEDRHTLERVMEALDVGEDRLKTALAWASEKAGRLKLNGQLTGYSPLSRLVELAGLTAGVGAKLCAWEALAEVQGHDPRLADFDFGELAGRAREQRRQLDELRHRAAHEALTRKAV